MKRWWIKYLVLFVVFLVAFIIFNITLFADGARTGDGIVFAMTIIYSARGYLVFVFIIYDVVQYIRRKKSDSNS